MKVLFRNMYMFIHITLCRIFMPLQRLHFCILVGCSIVKLIIEQMIVLKIIAERVYKMFYCVSHNRWNTYLKKIICHRKIINPIGETNSNRKFWKPCRNIFHIEENYFIQEFNLDMNFFLLLKSKILWKI